jgi:PepSY-associated TM region
MSFLATLHRWWGVAFCLLFAMWFASGIVMHFVPFPERHEMPATAGINAARDRAERIDYDQWTVSREYDRDRPLDRIAMKDAAGTEVYLSSSTGAVVLTTTRSARVANYLGSIPHWIYPTLLRHHARVWLALLWWLSLLGTIGAAIGLVVGVMKLGIALRDKAWPYRGLQAWHHALGLMSAPFILMWIFSGFLSLGEHWPLKSLHTLDFPPFDTHPALRMYVIVGLCLCGLAFSVTGVALAWWRVRASG